MCGLNYTGNRMSPFYGPLYADVPSRNILRRSSGGFKYVQKVPELTMQITFAKQGAHTPESMDQYAIHVTRTHDHI